MAQLNFYLFLSVSVYFLGWKLYNKTTFYLLSDCAKADSRSVLLKLTFFLVSSFFLPRFLHKSMLGINIGLRTLNNGEKKRDINQHNICTKSRFHDYSRFSGVISGYIRSYEKDYFSGIYVIISFHSVLKSGAFFPLLFILRLQLSCFRKMFFRSLKNM